MKLNIHTQPLILSILILVSVITISAHFYAAKQVQDKVKLNEVEPEGDDDSIDQLMGSEKCDNGDEECFKRRVIAEAHLDYIYTQNHKP